MKQRIGSLDEFINEAESNKTPLEQVFSIGKKNQLEKFMKTDFYKGEWQLTNVSDRSVTATMTEGNASALLYFSIMNYQRGQKNTYEFRIQLDAEMPRNVYGAERERFGTHMKRTEMGKRILFVDDQDYMKEYGEYRADFIEQVNKYLEVVKSSTGIEFTMTKYGFKK